MLFGLGAGILISAAASVWLLSLERAADPTSSEPIYDLRSQVKTDSSQAPSEAEGLSLAGFNPYAEQHQGFMGFATLHPRPDPPLPAVTRIPAFNDSPETPADDDPSLSYSSLEGDQVGIYIPDGIGFAGGGSPAAQRQWLNREILVVEKVDPEYPYVARMAGKEGKVVTLVYVDSLGRLAEFPSWVTGEGKHTLEYTVGGDGLTADYAYTEDPPDWFFAQNFLKVLPKWRFAPRIDNGRPVGALLRIRYFFCLGIDCEPYRLEAVTR